jgi:hypothetical protein
MRVSSVSVHASTNPPSVNRASDSSRGGSGQVPLTISVAGPRDCPAAPKAWLTRVPQPASHTAIHPPPDAGAICGRRPIFGAGPERRTSGPAGCGGWTAGEGSTTRS